MKKTYLITGGNGFIGRALTQRLLQAGYEVRILSRHMSKAPPSHPAVHIVQGDYNEVESLKKALKGCTGVFHLAAAIFGFDYQDFEKANILSTQNLVTAVNQTPQIAEFIYMSSLAASGYATDPKHPRTEEQTPAPASDYGLTKLGGERAVQTLRQEVKWTIIRPPIVYGKNDSGVSKIAAWVRRGLMVNTSGNGYFSFVHVDDLTHALAQVLTLAQTNHQIYFICEQNNYSWDYFISQMACAMGVKKPFMPSAPMWLLRLAAWAYERMAKLTATEPALNYDKVKEATIPGHWVCSSQKWTSLTGQTFTPLAQGLKKSF